MPDVSAAGAYVDAGTAPAKRKSAGAGSGAVPVGLDDRLGRANVNELLGAAVVVDMPLGEATPIAVGRIVFKVAFDCSAPATAVGSAENLGAAPAVDAMWCNVPPVGDDTVG